MSSRISIFSAVVVASCVTMMAASSARSQLSVAKGYVSLQAATPGTSQSGHANVSGTIQAGTLRSGSLTVTGGAGTGLVLKSDATGNATWQPDSLAVPATLIGSTGSFNAIITAKNLSTAAGVNGLYGEILSTQPDARAVMGLAQGGATGVFGITNTGVGVFGQSGPGGLAGRFDGDVYVTGNTRIGTTISSGRLTISAPNAIAIQASGGSDTILANATAGNAIAGSVGGGGVNAGGRFFSSSDLGFGVVGENINFVSGVGVFGKVSSPGGVGVKGENSSSGLAGQFLGRMEISGRTSIGTTATDAQLNVTSNNLQGIRVIASGSSPGVGLYATSPNDAVYGETTGNGSWAGGYFKALSSSAIGAVGVNFGGGVGLIGASGTANGIGVKGENLSGGRAGFFDGRLEVTGATSIGTNATNGLLTLLGNQADVLHITNSGAGRGMYILSPSDTGIWTNTNTGIAGIDARGSRADGYGVVATNNGAAAWAVFGFGRSGSTGTKSFRIDHPLDPENKFLLHYSAEGPEPMNVYSGNVTTDAKGEAWVQLPDYFGDINRDLRYTLTVVEDGDTDDFVMAKVARKVQNNRFKIRTSAPNVEVSWRVEGVRNDRWMQRNGAPSEMPKSDSQRGRFQHPELYDLPPSYSLLPAVAEAKAKK